MKSFLSFINNARFILILTILLSLLPIIVIIIKTFTGGIALWNDPARDLLVALDNLHKPTLIGPSTGIPGVFYGPYWIWLLSFGQLFSKQPGIIAFLILGLPYLIIFPLILSRFSKIFTHATMAFLWIIFLCTDNNYFTDLWNPHPAPLLILLAIYLQFIRPVTMSKKGLLITLVAGFATGLVMNFQLSFGIGMLFGSTIYLVGEQCVSVLRYKKKFRILHIAQSLMTVVTFFIGIGLAFIPFLLFELRHQFQQTKVLFNAFAHFGGGLVSQTGLTKPQILEQFFGKFADLLHLPSIIAAGVFILLVTYWLVNEKKSKNRANLQELKLIAIIICISFGVLYIYLTAKNPVWSYHFIGVEILALLLTGILFNRLRYIWLIFTCWTIMLSSQGFLQDIKNNPKTIYGTAASKSQTVTEIHDEARGQNYTIFAYESGIYPYEYSYLFRTMYNKDMPYRPELNPHNASLVFVILPPKLQTSIHDDFINFRTPPDHYATTAHWTQSDGTQILRRDRIK